MKMLCKGRMPDVLRKELVVPSASIAALVFRVVALFHPLWSLLKTEVAPLNFGGSERDSELLSHSGLYGVPNYFALGRTTMNLKALIAAAVLVSVAGPALADDFYVVQDVKTKKCTITEKKPTTTTETTVLGTTVFKTRTEAEAGMKKEKVCVTK